MGYILSSEGLSLNMRRWTLFWIWSHLPTQVKYVAFWVLLLTVVNLFQILKLLLNHWGNKLARKLILYVKEESIFRKTFTSKAPVLLFFHPTFETKIVAVDSKQSLGAILLQKTLKIVFFQPVAFGSCLLLNAEARYSETEREGLAVIFSCEQFKDFMYEMRFMTVTDHKPLLNLRSPFYSELPINWWSEADLGLLQHPRWSALW